MKSIHTTILAAAIASTGILLRSLPHAATTPPMEPALEFWTNMAANSDASAFDMAEARGQDTTYFFSTFDDAGALRSISVDCPTRVATVLPAGPGGVSRSWHAKRLDTGDPESPTEWQQRASTHVNEMCDGKGGQPHVDCGIDHHMFSVKGWHAEAPSERNLECARDRHRKAYGNFGLPGEDATVTRGIGHLEPFGMQEQSIVPVKEFVGCAEAATMEAVRRNLPVVQRGCLHATSPTTLRWTRDEYLQRRNSEDEPPSESNCSSAQPHWTCALPQCIETLLDYLQGSQNGSVTSHVWVCPCPPALLRDVVAPSMLQPGQLPAYFDKTMLWISAGNYTSALHFDPNENLMHMVEGEKELLLVDPLQSPLLYADYAQAALGNTPIDVRHVDLVAHPLVANVTIHHTTLRAGDIGLIPSGWWHLVVTPPAERRNVMLTVQFDQDDYGPPTHQSFSAQRAHGFLWKRHVSPMHRRPIPEGADPAAEPWTLHELGERSARKKIHRALLERKR